MVSGNEPEPVLISMAAVRRKCWTWCKREGDKLALIETSVPVTAHYYFQFQRATAATSLLPPKYCSDISFGQFFWSEAYRKEESRNIALA